MPVANTSNISTIQILRSYANSTPLTLDDGQLAYSFVSNTLFIGSNTGVKTIGDASTAIKAQAAYDQANAAYAQANVTIGVDASQNSRMTIADGVNTSQNVRLDFSNTRMAISDGVNTSQNVRLDFSNTRMTIIEGTDVSQNVRIDYSNAAITIIQGVDTSQNARMTISDGVNASQNLRIDYSNTAITIIQGVDVGQNARMTIIEGVDATQNTNISNKVNLTGSLNQTVSGNVTISQDLIVAGNLIINGNVTSQNIQQLAVADPLIILGIGNYVSDTKDIGFAGHYNDGTNAHAGLIRDSGTKEFYIFQGYVPELDSNNNVIITDATFRKANLNADYVKSNVISTTASVNGLDISSVWTTQNSRMTIIEGTDVGQNSRMTIIEGTDTSQNARMTIIEGVDVGQNTRMTIADGVNASQNIRVDYSNTAITIIQGVDTSQNARMTIIEGVDVTQNAATAATNQYATSAFSTANNAYTKANNALANTTGTFAGTLTVTGGLGVSGNTYLSGNVTVANTSTGLNTLQISQGYYTQETYIGITNSSTYGSIRYNINPGSGGAGHFFTTYGSPTSQGVIQFAAIATAGGSAVNYLQATGNTTGLSPVLSAQGSDTNVDITLVAKGTGSTYIKTGGNTAFKIDGVYGASLGATTAVNYWNPSGSAAGNGLRMDIGGSDTDVSMFYITKGAGSVFFNSGGSSGTTQFKISPTASAVNWVQVTGSTAGLTPVISAQGSDGTIALSIQPKSSGYVNIGNQQANYFQLYSAAATGNPTFWTWGSDTDVSLNIATKGAGNIYFRTNNGANTQFVVASTASAVNYIQVAGNATGQQPYFLAAGSDGSIGITYATKGTGAHFFSSGGGNYYQFNISNTNSAVNYLQVTGGTANGPNGNGASISVQGSSTDADMYMTAKGNGRINVASKMIVGNAAVATYYSAIAPFDGLIVANTSTGGAIGFGGTNGRSLSAYQNGTLSNFDMYAAQTYYVGDILVQGKISSPNGTSANLRITTTDANATIFIDRTVYIANANSSISNATGALILAGGMGITGNLYMSGANNFSTTTSQNSYRLGWTDNYLSRNPVYNGMDFNGNYLNINNQFITTGSLSIRNIVNNDSGNNTIIFSGQSGLLIQNGASSISNTTGALIVNGGLGLSGNLSMNLASSGVGVNRITLGQSNFIDSQDYLQVRFAGVGYYYFSASSGVYIDGLLRQRAPISNDIGNNTVIFAGSSPVKIQNGTASSNTTTGALVVQGGVGISGALNATTKSFNIPHPTKEGKDLRYGSLEGPEFGVYVRGTLKGSDTIELPDYWTKLVDANTITVSLTPIGKHQKLSVKEIKDNTIIINSDGWFKKEIHCYYVVYGERDDVDKLDVEG